VPLFSLQPISNNTSSTTPSPLAQPQQQQQFRLRVRCPVPVLNLLSELWEAETAALRALQSS